VLAVSQSVADPVLEWLAGRLRGTRRVGSV